MKGNKKEPCGNNALSKRNAYSIGMQLLSIDGLLHSMYYTTNDILFYSELLLLVLLSGLFCFNALTARNEDMIKEPHSNETLNGLNKYATCLQDAVENDMFR